MKHISQKLLLAGAILIMVIGGLFFYKYFSGGLQKSDETKSTLTHKEMGFKISYPATWKWSFQKGYKLPDYRGETRGIDGTLEFYILEIQDKFPADITITKNNNLPRSFECIVSKELGDVKINSGDLVKVYRWSSTDKPEVVCSGNKPGYLLKAYFNNKEDKYEMTSKWVSDPTGSASEKQQEKIFFDILKSIKYLK